LRDVAREEKREKRRRKRTVFFSPLFHQQVFLFEKLLRTSSKYWQSYFGYNPQIFGPNIGAMAPRLESLLVTICLLFLAPDILAYRPISSDSALRSSLRLKVSISPQSISTRVQKIKDISLQKDILRDITSAEFALKLEVKGQNNRTANIDYDGLISKLDRHLESSSVRDGILGASLAQRIETTIKSLSIAAANSKKVATGTVAPPAPAVAAQPKENPSLAELRQSFKVILREDGTVDWDGAATAGREVAKFGSELWERINGKEETEGMPSLQELLGQATVSEPSSEEIVALRVHVEAARSRFQSAVRYRDDVKAKLRQDRKDGRVLSKDDLKSLKRLDARVKELEKRLTLFTLDLDIERICAYLKQELESSIEPSDQRLFVAEVALAEKQLYSMVSGLQLESEASRALGNAPSPVSDILLAGVSEGDFDPAVTDDKTVDLVSLVDDNELALVVRQVRRKKDLKNVAINMLTVVVSTRCCPCQPFNGSQQFPLMLKLFIAVDMRLLL
jgi:rRNA maturation endonuclease Nob1